ncbi:hypothetical protein ANCCAN_02709 [Ancylostoma caninum]|uniref:Proteolipid membrane potential modulator n=1 Tax=Ancylostoma caninum TaxID=29170 RepID=A0A368H3G0_ANCCA|nr:hypothetical protein ANCCAN_02709 [Ancylostoma caninum]
MPYLVPLLPSRSSYVFTPVMAKCCLLVLAVFFPCCAVMIDRGCGGECCLTWFLSICGYIPGVLYAFIIILKEESRENQPIVVSTYVNQTTPTAPPQEMAIHSLQCQAPQPAVPIHQPSMSDAPPAYPVVDCGKT